MPGGLQKEDANVFGLLLLVVDLTGRFVAYIPPKTVTIAGQFVATT